MHTYLYSISEFVACVQCGGYLLPVCGHWNSTRCFTICETHCPKNPRVEKKLWHTVSRISNKALYVKNVFAICVENVFAICDTLSGISKNDSSSRLCCMCLSPVSMCMLSKELWQTESRISNMSPYMWIMWVQFGTRCWYNLWDTLSRISIHHQDYDVCVSHPSLCTCVCSCRRLCSCAFPPHLSHMCLKQIRQFETNNEKMIRKNKVCQILLTYICIYMGGYMFIEDIHIYIWEDICII